jgi:hypothetical protein
VRVVRSQDPVNARWDNRKQEAIMLDDAPAVSADVADMTMTVTSNEAEDETPAELVNEAAYRASDNKKKKQHHRINRETYRDYQDESQWDDEEQQVLLSESLRNDLRRLIAHGDCRFELSRKIYQGFKTAHDGRAPGENYTVTERPEHGACRYDLDQEVRQLKGVFSGDDDGPRYAITEFLVTKSAKKRGVSLKTLKGKSLAKLVAFAEEMGVESTGLMQKHELVHEILKGAELAEDPFVFDLGEGAAGGSAMQELARWLAAPEVRAVYQSELNEMSALDPMDTGSKPIVGLTNIHRIDMAIESWMEKVRFAALKFEQRFMYLTLDRVDEALARTLQTERDDFDRAVMTGSFEEINRLGESVCRSFEKATKAMEQEAAGRRPPAMPQARKSRRGQARYTEAVAQAKIKLDWIRKITKKA